jgi:hypothetical protein
MEFSPTVSNLSWLHRRDVKDANLACAACKMHHAGLRKLSSHIYRTGLLDRHLYPGAGSRQNDSDRSMEFIIGCRHRDGCRLCRRDRRECLRAQLVRCTNGVGICWLLAWGRAFNSVDYLLLKYRDRWQLRVLGMGQSLRIYPRFLRDSLLDLRY